ncbi:MAG TPA: hypothetical protein DCG48_07565 [Rhodospirillaceae bacterium]|nr:hypothetical protein [Rhodospirillaceae bacterium]|tara:strand:+ start:2328 stop:2564 length:237 start_codon:yes stop_codon:yes gene_type:complete
MSTAFIFTMVYLLGGSLAWRAFASQAMKTTEGAMLIWGASNGYLPAMIVKGSFLICWPLVLGLGHFLAVLGWRPNDGE